MAVGTKLMLCFGAMAAAVGGLGYAYKVSVAELSADLDVSANQTARKTELAGIIRIAIAEMRAGQRGVILFSMQKNAAKVQMATAAFDRNVSAIQSSLAEVTPMLVTETGRRDVATIADQLRAWLPLYRQIHQASDAGRFDPAMLAAVDTTVQMANRMQSAAEEVAQIQRDLMAAAAARAAEVSRRSHWIASLLVALCAAVGGLVFWVVRGLNLGLRRLAGQLGQGAQQVASAASQVSGASQSLAQGAAEQAASLEETSASTEEIESMARKNSEHSQSAAAMVLESQRRFSETNASLDQMVGAMDEIGSSSDKISKIIKVIDEIAFQTNILALNAAVEAARAGAAGLGFTVVADEVRNLAQRSAQAARDTAELIEDSIGKSRDGASKVHLVSAAIRVALDHSAEIKALVEEVSMGSQEQAHGIQQIGQAMVQMDQVTQRSSSAAQETASAAEELTAQSQALQGLVGTLTAMVGS
jgi:methyl-accepting chemotaxis protein/methyl-accepting chemotaxis protein-1 (serine sensor receptor)